MNNTEWMDRSIMLRAVAVLVVAIACGLAGLDRPGPATGQTVDALNLDAALAPLRERHSLPALGAMVVRGDRVVARGMTGVVHTGSTVAVKPEARFHIGSCTKSVTATMLARLIEQGKLSLSTTLAQAFPEIASRMNREYRAVTLQMLLNHRAGVPTFLRPTQKGQELMASLPADSIANRQAFALGVLKELPAYPPGSKQDYSNAGYAIAAAMAEKVTGQSWSNLVSELVFKPLHMATAGFGWPASEARPEEPWGHQRLGNALAPHPPGHPYQIQAPLSPAGDVHANLDDIARYLTAHLSGLQGRDGLLKGSSFARLHTPPSGQDYAMGWIRKSIAGEPASWHNGSAGTFFTWMTLWPQHNLAIAVVTNAGDSELACQEATTLLFNQALGREVEDPLVARARRQYTQVVTGRFPLSQVTPTLAELLRRDDVRAIFSAVSQLGAPTRFEYDGKETVMGFDRHKFVLTMNTPIEQLQKIRLQIGWDPTDKLHWFLIQLGPGS